MFELVNDPDVVDREHLQIVVHVVQIEAVVPWQLQRVDLELNQRSVHSQKVQNGGRSLSSESAEFESSQHRFVQKFSTSQVDLGRQQNWAPHHIVAARPPVVEQEIRPRMILLVNDQVLVVRWSDDWQRVTRTGSHLEFRLLIGGSSVLR